VQPGLIAGSSDVSGSVSPVAAAAAAMVSDAVAAALFLDSPPSKRSAEGGGPAGDHALPDAACGTAAGEAAASLLVCEALADILRGAELVVAAAAAAAAGSTHLSRAEAQCAGVSQQLSAQEELLLDTAVCSGNDHTATAGWAVAACEEHSGSRALSEDPVLSEGLPAAGTPAPLSAQGQQGQQPELAAAQAHEQPAAGATSLGAVCAASVLAGAAAAAAAVGEGSSRAHVKADEAAGAAEGVTAAAAGLAARKNICTDGTFHQQVEGKDAASTAVTQWDTQQQQQPPQQHAWEVSDEQHQQQLMLPLSHSADRLRPLIPAEHMAIVSDLADQDQLLAALLAEAAQAHGRLQQQQQQQQHHAEGGFQKLGDASGDAPAAGGIFTAACGACSSAAAGGVVLLMGWPSQQQPWQQSSLSRRCWKVQQCLQQVDLLLAL